MEPDFYTTLLLETEDFLSVTKPTGQCHLPTEKIVFIFPVGDPTEKLQQA